jgi:hypothetical protein
MNRLLTKLLIFLFLLFSIACERLPKENPPGHVRVVIKNDPATSFVIGWTRYGSKDKDDFLYYDTVDHGDDLSKYRYKIKPDFYSSLIAIESAFVELTGLTPETNYYFIIQGTYGVTKRYYVQTLPDRRDARISFIEGGDSRNNREPRRAANLLVSKLKPHYVMFGGDMTNLGTTYEWADWFDDWQLTIGNDGRVTPVAVTRGNHELSNQILNRFFWIPLENYYGFRVADGLIHNFVLNTESSMGGDQLNWLINELESSQDADWRIAMYHRPMLPHVKDKDEGTNQYKFWAKPFYEFGVELVLESDAHTVKSTHPIRPTTEKGSQEGFIRDDETGTVYVGEGCWGAPLREADDNKVWTRDSGMFNQFRWVFVDQDKIEMRTIKVDNGWDVGEVSLNNRFKSPSNLDIWQSTAGSVHLIEKSKRM